MFSGRKITCLQTPSSEQWVLKQWASCIAIQPCRTKSYPHTKSPNKSLSSASACQRAQTPIATSQWFCTGAFVRSKLNIAADPQSGYIPSTGNTHEGICKFCALWKGWEKKHQKKNPELIPGRREEKNITEGACAQPKLFPEHISWMAQLMHPESTLPAFPAKLFLPPLDGITSWWKQHCINPSLSPGDRHDRAIVVTAGLEPFTMQAARVVTNRASIDI